MVLYSVKGSENPLKYTFSNRNLLNTTLKTTRVQFVRATHSRHMKFGIKKLNKPRQPSTVKSTFHDDQSRLSETSSYRGSNWTLIDRDYMLLPKTKDVSGFQL